MCGVWTDTKVLLAFFVCVFPVFQWIGDDADNSVDSDVLQSHYCSRAWHNCLESRRDGMHSKCELSEFAQVNCLDMNSLGIFVADP